MTRRELDEILFRWPGILRGVIARGADDWAIGFAKSIAKQGKRASWTPSARQAAIMRRLVAEHETATDPELIED
jgi:hypothetical protein